MEVLETTYFECNAQDMLRNAGLTKAAFAEKMGVAAQNVNKTIATKNVYTLMKISKLLGLSLNYLISGEAEIKENINGYVEVNATIYKIQSKQDLLNLIEKL